MSTELVERKLNGIVARQHPSDAPSGKLIELIETGPIVSSAVGSQEVEAIQSVTSVPRQKDSSEYEAKLLETVLHCHPVPVNATDFVEVDEIETDRTRTQVAKF
jgi:hypothetical protein